MKRTRWTVAAMAWWWALGAWAAAAGPLEAVEAVNRAIETHNATLFERAVDVPNLTTQILEGAARQLAAHPPQDDEPLVAVVAKLLGQPGGEMGRILADEGRRYLLWGIRSGAFAGRAREEAPREGLLAALLAQVSPGRKELRAAQVVEEDGVVAIVEADLVDHGTGSVYPLALRLGRGKEGWRILHLLNVESLTARIRAEARTP